MKQLTPQEVQVLAECDEAIAIAQAKLNELSEDWRIYKGELTKRELAIREQQSIIAILRQRVFEIDPHHGLEPKGTANE